jgi:hypothetical protein
VTGTATQGRKIKVAPLQYNTKAPLPHEAIEIYLAYKIIDTPLSYETANALREYVAAKSSLSCKNNTPPLKHETTATPLEPKTDNAPLLYETT